MELSRRDRRRHHRALDLPRHRWKTGSLGRRLLITTLERASGALEVTLRQRRDGRTAIAGLRQEGCLKARFPRAEGDAAEIITVNVSGGVAAGDQLATKVMLAAGARATVAGQAAERFYRARPGSPPARVRTSLTVAEGASLEWLPQETILFDAAHLDRRLDVDIAHEACFVGIESLVFGRAAMGESVERLHLRDTIEVRLGGRLVLHDAVRLVGEARRVLSRRATGRGLRAFATVLCAGPGRTALLDPVRDVLSEAPAEAGASVWDGLLVARIAAADGARLRAAVVAVLRTLRGGSSLPRAWSC